MALAARRLADVELSERPAGDGLDGDPDFLERRRGLETAIVKVVRRNTSEFDDPWGLVALFLASDGTARVSAKVISPKFMLFLPAA